MSSPPASAKAVHSHASGASAATAALFHCRYSGLLVRGNAESGAGQVFLMVLQ